MKNPLWFHVTVINAKGIKPKLSEIRISEQLSCIYSPTLHNLKIYVVLCVDDSAIHETQDLYRGALCMFTERLPLKFSI